MTIMDWLQRTKAVAFCRLLPCFVRHGSAVVVVRTANTSISQNLESEVVALSVAAWWSPRFVFRLHLTLSPSPILASELCLLSEVLVHVSSWHAVPTQDWQGSSAHRLRLCIRGRKEGGLFCDIEKATRHACLCSVLIFRLSTLEITISVSVPTPWCVPQAVLV